MTAVQVQIQYVGFVTNGKAREYTLRVRTAAGDVVEVTLAIPTEAFLKNRVRYQDAPEICFIKLQKELSAGDGRLHSYVSVLDVDLEEYRAAHAPKPPRRSPKPTPLASGS